MKTRKEISFQDYEKAWAELKKLPEEALVTGDMFCLVHGGIAAPTLRKYIRAGIIPRPIENQRINRQRCWPAVQVRKYFEKLAKERATDSTNKGKPGRPRITSRLPSSLI